MGMSTKGINFLGQTTLALDANDTNSVTTVLDIKDNMDIVWSVLEKTGAHTTHVFTFQRSTDNVNWDNTPSTVTAGVTYQVKTGISAAVRYVRIKCTTAEGSASTVDVVINAK